MAQSQHGNTTYEEVPAIEMLESGEKLPPPPPEILGRRHGGSTLEWKGINYTVSNGNTNKVENSSKQVASNSVMTNGVRTLLNNLSGRARPGELLAVMGTSGAGKSTLLDVLAGRLESPTLTGSLTVNGREVDKRSFRKDTGYVMQSDALFPLLTVRETIRYAAYLRIQDKTTQEKNEIADSIIKLLRLEKCADTIIGDDDNRGLSGGEKRRVSIAVDIVHFPPVIFLDEPTSGLDSSTALSVIDSLKTLAVQMNCTVVMTIHQPSTRLFQLLDQVIFLCAGKVTYQGPVANLSSYIDAKFKEASLGPAPIGNPPEVFLDFTDQLLIEDRLSVVTNTYYGQDAEKIVFSDKALISSTSGTQETSYANDFFTETTLLMSRAMTNIMRTKELFMGRVFSAIFFGILIGTLFLNSENDSLLEVNHLLSYFVFTIAFFYYTSLEALPIFLSEREIFQREFSRGAYRAASYTIATLLVQLPFLLGIALLYTCITWWLVGLPNLATVFWFQVLCVFTVLVTGHVFATMFSVLVPNPMAGQTAGSGLFSVMFLFSGFFIRGEDIPKYWYWLYYSSLFKFAYDSMMVNGLKDHAIFEASLAPNNTNEDVLKYYSVDGVNMGLGIGILWGWIIFYRLIFYYRLVTAFSGARK